MARPRKDDSERRTEAITVRLTASERLRIDESALAASTPPSEFVRRQALDGRIVQARRTVLDPAAFDQLRRIGINLNQLARLANTTGTVPPELSSVCQTLETFIAAELGHGSTRR